MPTAEQLNPPPEATDGDGSSTEAMEDGSAVTSWPDGTSRVDYPDGTATITYPDFAVLNLNTDGTVPSTTSMAARSIRTPASLSATSTYRRTAQTASSGRSKATRRSQTSMKLWNWPRRSPKP